MEIVSIFDDCLYSFKTSEGDELSDFLKRISDVEWLMNFFQDNIEDLQSGFYGSITCDEATRLTLEEAKLFRKKLVTIKALKESNKDTGLDVLFKPLVDTETRNKGLQKSKAKGSKHKNWLRIYAIKLEDGSYIITGGTLKLTQSMNTKDHTLKELRKLELCRDFLKSKDIIDHDSFVEFLNE
ncbi:MAG TPA: hypothetical protein VLB84_17560 [Bacteroidia bacterium]|nr:hypothetical protein [Bacteroidia bacterium]